jgi:hypothetical protein
MIWIAHDGGQVQTSAGVIDTNVAAPNADFKQETFPHHVLRLCCGWRSSDTSRYEIGSPVARQGPRDLF